MTPKDFYSDLWTKANSEFNAFLSDKGMKGAREKAKDTRYIPYRILRLYIHGGRRPGGGEYNLPDVLQRHCN